MGDATKLYLVIKEDTVLQGTGYLVRAASKEKASEYVDKGMYIEETRTEVLDTLDSQTKDVLEISDSAEGQVRA